MEESEEDKMREDTSMGSQIPGLRRKGYSWRKSSWMNVQQYLVSFIKECVCLLTVPEFNVGSPTPPILY